MERKVEIIEIASVEQIPSLDFVRRMPRGCKLKLVFNYSMQNQREKTGAYLKKCLEGFQVGVHMVEPEISIAKLITDKEIECHQNFFEDCAKDYRKLATELINKLASALKIVINPVFPLLTFNPLKGSNRQSGEIDGCRYYLHGFHCGFTNVKTKQWVEVPLTFGLEFGDLDPYFFTGFIKSTPTYHPLPIQIYEDYSDGVRIIETMKGLGKFENINSNFENSDGVVVVDRSKIDVKIYRE